jgi:hypothetical protein
MRLFGGKHKENSIVEKNQLVGNEQYLFSMKIDDVFSISGRGTVVMGKIEFGSVKLNEKVAILGGNQTINTKITGIELFNKVTNEAKEGDTVGLLLDKVNKNEVKKGYIVVKNEEYQLEEMIKSSKIETVKDDQRTDRKRMEDTGLKLYVWSTCGDERVRPSHALMDGKLCKWADPTVYSSNGGKAWKSRPKGAVLGHPGEEDGCRCTALSYEKELLGGI